MLDFSSKKLFFTFNGKEHEIKYPTVKQFNDFRSGDHKDKTEIEVCVDFCVACGADKDIVEQLTLRQLNMLIRELTLENEDSDSKKN